MPIPVENGVGVPYKCCESNFPFSLLEEWLSYGNMTYQYGQVKSKMLLYHISTLSLLR